MTLLSKGLTKEWSEEILHEDVKISMAVFHDLYGKGNELGKAFEEMSYADKKGFFEDHDQGNSPFVKLEGKSERKGNIFMLKVCPMMELLDASSRDGNMPKHFELIVENWKSIYKRQGAVLHPYCIVHQVVRSTIGEGITAGKNKLRVVQIACRSTKNGKVVFAEEGIETHNLYKDEVVKKMDGYVCMYGVE